MLLTLSVLMFESSCSKITPVEKENYDEMLETAEIVVNSEAVLNMVFIDVFNLSLKAGVFADSQINKAAEVDGLSKKELISTSNFDAFGGQMEIFINKSRLFPAVTNVNWGKYNETTNSIVYKNIEDNGLYRKGSIITTMNDFWNKPGVVMNVDLNSDKNTGDKQFHLNNYPIDGKLTIQYNGMFELMEGNEYKKFTLELENGTVASPEDKDVVSSNNSTLHLLFKSGFDTASATDDVWIIYGTIEGVTSSGVEYSSVITKEDALIKKTNCVYPESGIANYTTANANFTIDYSYKSNILDVCNYEVKLNLLKEGEIVEEKIVEINDLIDKYID